MFLNWVYRELSLGGFQNIDWSGLSSCVLTGPVDVEPSGDMRYSWIDDHMEDIGNIYGW